jgi:hypothetical protein
MLRRKMNLVKTIHPDKTWHGFNRDYRIKTTFRRLPPTWYCDKGLISAQKSLVALFILGH